MTAPFFAHGTTLDITSIDVGGLVSLDLPGQTRGDVEITQGSSGGDRQYKPGLREGGVVAIEARLLPEDAGQDALRSNFNASSVTATVVTFTITLPPDADDGGTTTYTFSGYVNALGGNLPQSEEEPASFTAQIKVTGNVVKASA